MLTRNRIGTLIATSTYNEKTISLWRSGADESQAREGAFLPPLTICVVVTAWEFQQEQLNNFLNSIEFIIGKNFFKEVPELEAVYFDKEGDTINVWSVLKDFSRPVREKIYTKEAFVIKEFPSLVFNFRTTDAKGEMMPASSGFKKVSRAVLYA